MATRVRTWVLRILAGLAILVCLLGTTFWIASSARLGQEFDVPAHAVPAVADSATLVRGERLTRVLGCRGCHTEDLGGQIFAEDPALGRITAPNLTEVRERYADEDFERLLRHGVRPDGSAVLIAMPSASYAHLADDDLAAVVAYLRTVPAVERTSPPTRAGPLLRLFSFLEELRAPGAIDHDAPHPATADRSSPEALGAYLTRTICTECHGPDLRGEQSDFMSSPSLAVAAGYTDEQFLRFLREGITAGGGELPLMSQVARGRATHYTDEEIAAIHAFARRLAATPEG